MPLLEMALHVHPLMQDADHNDGRSGHTIRQEMRPDRIPPITRAANIITTPSKPGIGRYSLGGRLDESSIVLSLSLSPLLGRVIPDFAEVRLRARRDDDTHLQF